MSGRKYCSCKQTHGLLYQLIKKFGLSIMVYYTNLCNNSVIVPWSIISFKKDLFFINSVTGSWAYSQLKLKKIKHKTRSSDRVTRSLDPGLIGTTLR